MSLSVVGKYIALTWRIFLANLSSALSFRLSFFLYILGVMVYFGGQFFMWIVFFNQFPMIGGWTSKDVVLVFSIYTFSGSILDVFAGGLTDLAKVINSGNLDYYLSFPKPILWHLAVSKSEVETIGAIFLSLGIFLIFGPLHPLRILLFFLASLISMIFIFNFWIITQSIAFFIGGFDQGASAVRHLLAIVSPYPFNIFPNPLKFLLMTIIPSFFVVTLPARLVDNFSIQTLIMLICACIVSSLIARFVFKSGLKRYESGNMVNVRV